MVSGAGLWCLMYCGAEDRQGHVITTPQPTEALGAEDSACPQQFLVRLTKEK